MGNTSLQDCMIALEERKLANDYMADKLRQRDCTIEQLEASLRSLTGQFKILLTDRDYEARM